jgi:hypothetical protein
MVSRTLFRASFKALLVLGAFASLLLTAPTSRASDIYIAQNAVGAGSGADCNDALAVSYLNTAANWVAGNTYHLCGTFNFAAGGGISVLAGGTSGSPVTVQFESGATLQGPYLGGGGGTCNMGDMCTGAITVGGLNNVIIDGGASGIIQNTANGTGLANGHSSVGVFLSGSNLTVRNLTIQNIYTNQGSSSSASDTNGLDTADIRVDAGSSNITINNNTLNNARCGIWADTSGSNVNVYNNTIMDHAWHISLNGSGSPTVHDNQISNWTNWQFPSSAFHTDGIIAYGDNSIITPSIYNNYIYGDLGAGSPTGFIFCTYGSPSSGSGSACTIYNNLLVGTGYSANNDQGMYFHSGNGTNTLGPHYIYNNTFVGFLYQIYAEGDPNTIYTIQNNVFVGNGSQWYLEGNSSPIGNLTANNNIYYGGRSYGPFSWGSVSNGQFSAWQAAGEDAASSIANPMLSATFQLSNGSPAVNVGANLTSLGISGLMVGQPSVVGANATATGVARSSSASNWPAGAFGNGTAGPTLPAAPTGLVATVQ